MDYKTKSGADLTVNIAPFRDVMNLKNAIQKTIKSEDLSQLGNLDIESLKKGNSQSIFSGIVNAILSVDSSEDVYKATFKCLERCTYNDEKVTERLFEKEEVRVDYYEIMFFCIKDNLEPFFRNVLSALPNITAMVTSESQKQK
jgi:hypothetical protein